MKKVSAFPVVLFSIFNLSTANAASNDGVSTQTGQGLGISFASYQYQEPGVDVKNEGVKFGLDYLTTLALQDDSFVKLNGRVAYGDVDYTGSGTSDNNPDYYYELRGLLGVDHALGYSMVSPYTGFGFRELHNDSRGTTSTGYEGYRRISRYYYVPVGINHRFSLDSHSILDSMLEFDYLIRGLQTSQLSDVSTSYPDVDNRQDSGYGVKLSAMYRVREFAIGPYLDYWNVNQSDTIYYSAGNATYFGYEPQNHTMEWGIKASMRF